MRINIGDLVGPGKLMWLRYPDEGKRRPLFFLGFFLYFRKGLASMKLWNAGRMLNSFSRSRDVLDCFTAVHLLKDLRHFCPSIQVEGLREAFWRTPATSDTVCEKLMTESNPRMTCLSSTWSALSIGGLMHETSHLPNTTRWHLLARLIEEA